MPEAIMVDAPVVPAATPAAPAVALPTEPAATPATSPAPAAAATPAVPAASFDEPPAAAPTPPSQDTVVYEKTGDKSLDVALRYVGQRGFKPEHPAMVAATKGDFAPLEAAMKALGDKAAGFEDYIDLAKESYSRRQAQAKTAQDRTNAAVYEAVGGAANWTAIHAWAVQHADPDEKASLNAAFKAGGVAATAAARHLGELYAKHGKTAPKAVVKADASAVQATGNGPLSGRDYAREVKQLSAKLGTKMEESPEYRQLQARHAAYRAS